MHSENLDCVGQIEIGQTGYLLNHPCMYTMYFSFHIHFTLKFTTVTIPKFKKGSNVRFI